MPQARAVLTEWMVGNPSKFRVRRYLRAILKCTPSVCLESGYLCGYLQFSGHALVPALLPRPEL
jgi:hypothetical protein